MQGEDNVGYDNDPYLVNVQRECKRIEKEVDDIIWEQGANDPRLEQLLAELKRLRELDEAGVTHDPTF